MLTLTHLKPAERVTPAQVFAPSTGEAASGAEWRHEIGYDVYDDRPAEDEEAILACLEADVDAGSCGDPIKGIRNGVIAGSLVWALIAAFILLLT